MPRPAYREKVRALEKLRGCPAYRACRERMEDLEKFRDLLTERRPTVELFLPPNVSCFTLTVLSGAEVRIKVIARRDVKANGEF